MTKRFSVIIPTRNREHFLKEAVTSVLAQVNTDLEILVINDGDPLAATFTDSRVKILDNARRTAVPARNLGVAKAQGEFIAFLDDDDYFIDRHHLANASAAFEHGADFYFANGEMRFPDGGIKPFDRSADVQTLEKDNTILVSAVAYRRSIHDRLGIFDEALPYYWDWDWYLRVSRGGYQLHHEISFAVAIRVHSNNMSSGNDAARRANLDSFSLKHGLKPIPLKNHMDFI